MLLYSQWSNQQQIQSHAVLHDENQEQLIFGFLDPNGLIVLLQQTDKLNNPFHSTNSIPGEPYSSSTSPPLTIHSIQMLFPK